MPNFTQILSFSPFYKKLLLTPDMSRFTQNQLLTFFFFKTRIVFDKYSLDRVNIVLKFFLIVFKYLIFVHLLLLKFNNWIKVFALCIKLPL